LIAILLIFLFALKELTIGEESFTPSDVERALWSSAIGSKLPTTGNLKSESKNAWQEETMIDTELLFFTKARRIY